MDRLLALALQTYEDDLCDGCGQSLTESMDPDLADEWATLPPHRCAACTALAAAAERAEKDGTEHPRALRWVIGLREGWQERRSAARAERAAANEPGQHQ